MHYATFYVKTFDAALKSVGLGVEKKSWFLLETKSLDL